MERPPSSSGPRPRESVGTPRSTEPDLSTLVATLGDGILALLDSKATLLKLDLQEAVHSYERKTLALALAVITVAIGAVLAACGIAFAVVYALPAGFDPLLARALAFGTLGTLAIVAGIVVLRRGPSTEEHRHG